MGASRSADESLRVRLSGPDVLLGTFLTLPGVAHAEIVASSGFDVVVIDMEHGQHSAGDLPGLVMAVHGAGALTLVRTAPADLRAVGRALDAGADGVLAAGVSSVQAAQELVDAARFAPFGRRGANPWVRAARYGARKEWFAEADRETAVIAMVEGLAGLEALEGIVSCQGLDAIFLGPVDLSHALGVPGQVDHPLVTNAVAASAESINRHGKSAGVFAVGPSAAHRWVKAGARLVIVAVDAEVVRDAYTRLADTARSSPT